MHLKEHYFRVHGKSYKNGHIYVCPICKRVFSGFNGFKQLHADHIKPYSKSGKTIWENMQLLCKSCNLVKNNKY